MFWTAIGAVLTLGAAAYFYWRKRKRAQPRLISFVGLLREPVTFDPAVLANVAGRAWDADLGDGESEGPDGFVASAGVITTIVYAGRFFIIHCMPGQYVPDEAAASIGDLRRRSLCIEHKAWFSCDIMGIDGTSSDEEVRGCYQQLGILFAELLDENCLLIVLPDSNETYPIDEKTETALRSRDPVKALRESAGLPVIEVSADDPLLKQAVATARASWPDFVAAFESRAGENFSVKAPVTHAENTEFIWMCVTSIEGERVYGELGNDPVNLGPLKLGSKVFAPIADLNDWLYLDAQGDLIGGFTIKAVQEASRRPN